MSYEYYQMLHHQARRMDWKLTGSPDVSIGFWIKVRQDRPVEPSSTVHSVCSCCSRIANLTQQCSHHHWQYTPLPDDGKTTRLFVLEAGEYHEPLRGRLMDYDPTAKTLDCGYEALSYCWGEHRDKATLWPGDSSFSITWSFETALRSLRLEDHVRVLWIDQICINQNDLMERSSQVNIMMSIYAGARNVCVWLGEADDSTQDGMSILQSLSAPETSTSTPFWEILPPRPFLRGLNGIMERAWFKRIWVVQEAAVSQNVTIICGKHQFFWPSHPSRVYRFLRMVKLAEMSPNWVSRGSPMGHGGLDMELLVQLLNLQLDHALRGAPRPKPDLLDIAYETRKRMSVDPRDKLYALMGLAGRSDGAPFEPDYRLSHEQVYKQFWHLMIARMEIGIDKQEKVLLNPRYLTEDSGTFITGSDDVYRDFTTTYPRVGLAPIKPSHDLNPPLSSASGILHDTIQIDHETRFCTGKSLQDSRET